MTRDELNESYFEWMYQLVYTENYCRNKSYHKLLTFLNNIDFTYSIGLDGNRAEDGIELRYRFGYEQGLIRPMIADYLDHRSCSVLEMLIALSIRCEDHIMADPEIGDRTGKWFWGMICNLGLMSMTDESFEESFVDYIIHRFLQRKYGPNGEGGLFTVNDCATDLRRVEIWYQMCWYLNKFI